MGARELYRFFYTYLVRFLINDTNFKFFRMAVFIKPLYKYRGLNNIRKVGGGRLGDKDYKNGIDWPNNFPSFLSSVFPYLLPVYPHPHPHPSLQNVTSHPQM